MLAQPDSEGLVERLADVVGTVVVVQDVYPALAPEVHHLKRAAVPIHAAEQLESPLVAPPIHFVTGPEHAEGSDEAILGSLLPRQLIFTYHG
jgi:hypothetical protein